MTFPSLLLVASLAAAPEPAPRPFAMRALIPLTVGSVLLIGGGIFLGLSVAQTNDAALLEPEPREALLSAATSNRVGGVMLVVGGVLVSSIAAFLFWFVPEPRVTIGMTPIAGGALFSLGWRAP